MIKFLTKLLMKYAELRNRVYNIKDEKDSDLIYMVRYIIFRTPWISLYIHRFLKSDLQVPHDHPFNFYSYMVQGTYTEWNYDKNNNFSISHSKRKEGSLEFRNAEHIHRIQLDKEYNMFEKENAPITMCLLIRKNREWGFWTPSQKDPNSRRWIYWKAFLGLPDTYKSEGHE